VTGSAELLVRPDGRAASRAHLLVIPSVVCANAVASQIAESVPGALSVTHQHGCAQIGDDAVQTSAALERLARHPNAWATLIVSLGCETLQGGVLEARLREDGLECGLVGIQAEGGSAATVEAGRRLLGATPPRPYARERHPASVAVAVAYVGGGERLAVRYAGRLRAAGFDVLDPVDASGSPVLTSVELTLANGALAMVLVGDKLVNAPILTPLIAVATDEERFELADGEFDLLNPSDAELIDSVTETLSGSPSASESRGDAAFSIRRTLVTL
jgi:altronate dehydratase